MKKLVAAGTTADALRVKFETRGVIGTRLGRIIRIAGMVFDPTSGAYVRRHSGETPIRRMQKRGLAKVWLEETLKKGPLLYNDIERMATKSGVTIGSVKFNSHALMCQRHDVWICIDPTRKKPPIEFTFWGLPGQAMPTNDEANQVIAKYQREAAAREKEAAAKRTKRQAATVGETGHRDMAGPEVGNRQPASDLNGKHEPPASPSIPVISVVNFFV